MFNDPREGSDRPNQDVFCAVKSATSKSIGPGDFRSICSESAKSHGNLARSRPRRLSAVPSIRRYRKCNICSTTYRARAGTERENGWGFNRSSSSKPISFVSFSFGSRMVSIWASAVVVLLFLVLVSTVFWIFHYHEGLGCQKSIKTWFNWHPVAMVTGFITISGTSMLVPKQYFLLKPPQTTFFHVLLHICVVPCAVFGVITVLDHHNMSQPSIPNFRSMHSWLGLMALGFYALQFFVGVSSFFVYNRFEESGSCVPSSITGLHKLFGAIGFGLATINCLTGFSEYISRQKKSGSEEQLFLNCLGIITFLTGVAVILFLKFAKI